MRQSNRQRADVRFVVQPKQEYFLRLKDAIEAGGMVDLQRAYREQGFWTAHKRIDPLVR